MNYSAKFLTHLVVSPLDDGINWRLGKPLMFLDRRGDLHIVPTGFKTDFASVPPLAFIGGLVLCFSVTVLCIGCWFHILQLVLWMSLLTAFAVWVVIVSDKFNCDDSGSSRLDAPATVHDNGYRRLHLGSLLSQIQMKQYWDMILYEAMVANKVDPFTARTVWFMLLLFGWFAYFSDGRKEK